MSGRNDARRSRQRTGSTPGGSLSRGGRTESHVPEPDWGGPRADTRRTGELTGICSINATVDGPGEFEYLLELRAADGSGYVAQVRQAVPADAAGTRTIRNRVEATLPEPGLYELVATVDH